MLTGPDPQDDAAREFVERVQGLFRQAHANGRGAALAAVCLVGVMFPFVGDLRLAGWLLVYLTIVAARIPLVGAYGRDDARDARAGRWADRYTAMVAAGGLCWAAAPFLFLDPNEPLAVASFIAIVALVAAGSIASQSFHLPPVVAFVSLTLLPAAAWLLATRDWRYLPLAATVLVFHLFLVANARTQNRKIAESIRLRHRNLDLIAALESGKREADRLRDAAEQANRAKSRFLAAATHDLRQPLHALGLFSAALRDRRLEPEQRVLVDRIFTSVDALESMCGALLDLSRLDAGHVQPVPVHALLDPILHRLDLQHRPVAERKGLAFAVPATGLAVVTDPVLFERMLGNLVANAVRYTAQGSVRIDVQPGDGQIDVHVADTGPGIPEDARDRVFDEFFQLPGRGRDGQGLGLGLAIVRRLARRLDHAIALDSVPGRGSVFTLTLPAGDPAQVPALRTGGRDSAPWLTGRRVLVVDDDPAVREGAATLLTQWGCEVRVAGSGAEALDTFDVEGPELLVVDLRLGERAGDGLEVVASLHRRHGREVPVLIITGDTSVDELERLRGAGFPVLHKPVRANRLRAALTQLLAAPNRVS